MKLDKKERVIPLMYLISMADYQSQECLVIPILVIPKERPKNGKNIMICLACNPLSCTPVCTGANNSDGDINLHL